jgi:hypothetical protein
MAVGGAPTAGSWRAAVRAVCKWDGCDLRVSNWDVEAVIRPLSRAGASSSRLNQPHQWAPPWGSTHHRPCQHAIRQFGAVRRDNRGACACVWGGGAAELVEAGSGQGGWKGEGGSLQADSH